MARPPRNTVALTPGGAITKDMILGYYALFSVPDTPVSAATLKRLWNAEGLTSGLVPKTRRAVNAFQVACRSVETRRHGSNGGSQKGTEVKVDEVLENDQECVYQITHMIREKNEKVIEHPKAMRVTFTKSNERIDFDRLTRTGPSDLRHLEQAIRNHYEENANKVPGAKIRAAVRGLLDEMHATAVRRKSGGVYFCPPEGKETLDSLGAVLDGLYKHEAEMHLIPCANDEGQRKMVERHLTVNVSEELNTLMAECTTRLRSGNGARSDRMNNIVNRRNELKALAEKYRTILDSNLATVDEQMDILDEQVTRLSEAGSDL